MNFVDRLSVKQNYIPVENHFKQLQLHFRLDLNQADVKINNLSSGV